VREKSTRLQLELGFPVTREFPVDVSAEVKLGFVGDDLLCPDRTHYRNGDRLERPSWSRWCWDGEAHRSYSLQRGLLTARVSSGTIRVSKLTSSSCRRPAAADSVFVRPERS
jgi:hypothetical protein